MSQSKEAIILNNAVIIKKSVSKYDLNSRGPQHETLEIQRMLEKYSVYLEEKIMSLFDYMLSLKFVEATEADSSYHDWITEVRKVQEGYYKKGLKILNGIITELSKRKISGADYRLYKDIIINQRDIAKNILDKEVQLNNLEDMIAYIKDAPTYLKFDLRVESLPYRSQKTEVEIKEHSYVQYKQFYNIA